MQSSPSVVNVAFGCDRNRSGCLRRLRFGNHGEARSPRCGRGDREGWMTSVLLSRSA